MSNTPEQNWEPDECTSDVENLDRPLDEVLGLPLIFEPDDQAPPVDAERLRSFVANALPRDESRDVLRFVVRFRNWREALSQEVRNRPSFS